MIALFIWTIGDAISIAVFLLIFLALIAAKGYTINPIS